MATSRQPGLRVSEYLLEERIGEGAFAEVWRARHHIWESERVAVKLPTEPEYVRYLQREGVMVHGLRHPNIVRVLGLDPYADVPYMVMELVRGPSLKHVLQEHEKGLPIEPAITVLRGVLEAMAAAHAAGVLHRDLKPGNVLLDLNGRPLGALTVEHVKVGDFGLGLADTDALRAIAQSASLARSERLVGTLAYMAPELRDAPPEHVPDARSDLYSIGVMLFEMLTGQRPAGAELPSTLRAQVPAVLDEVFERLYARYDRRYESAQAALDDLELRLSGAWRPAKLGGHDVILSAAGAHTMELTKLVREARPHLKPAEARRFIDELPRPLLEGLDYHTAQNWKKRLEALGARATVVVGRTPRPVRPAASGRADDPGAALGELPPLPSLDEGSTPARRCPDCGEVAEPYDQFCTLCGQQLVREVRRCADCGFYPGPEDRYCILCGARLPALQG